MNLVDRNPLPAGIWHLAVGIWHLASSIWHLASSISQLASLFPTHLASACQLLVTPPIIPVSQIGMQVSWSSHAPTLGLGSLSKFMDSDKIIFLHCLLWILMFSDCTTAFYSYLLLRKDRECQVASFDIRLKPVCLTWSIILIKNLTIWRAHLKQSKSNPPPPPCYKSGDKKLRSRVAKPVFSSSDALSFHVSLVRKKCTVWQNLANWGYTRAYTSWNQYFSVKFNVVQCCTMYRKVPMKTCFNPQSPKVASCIFTCVFCWKQCTYIWAIWHISISISSECKYWLLSKLNMQQDNYWRKNNQIWVLIHCVFPFLFLNVYWWQAGMQKNRHSGVTKRGIKRCVAVCLGVKLFVANNERDKS